MSYPTHCPTCRQPLQGVRRWYCGWGLATVDRCRACGEWVIDEDGLELIEHDACPQPRETLSADDAKVAA